MTLPEITLRRLETQLDVVSILLAGARPEQIEARPAPETWSARENLAHLARHHRVFLERIGRILAEETPDLGRYRAEDDPEWPEWKALPLEEILARLDESRRKILAVALELNEEKAARRGRHPVLGAMPLSRWFEFFLLHEAHHLYVVMLRLGPAA
ncbi:MAG TPA: DinB family protein [Thermoanaerobaculia bacterium]|nr:DinB family protein [Thermoanaerobaculia bacterium]